MEDMYNDEKAFYGEAWDELVAAENLLHDQIGEICRKAEETGLRNPVEHYKSRFKSVSSMSEKLKRSGLPQTSSAVLSELHDALGIRIICTFIDDVYAVAKSLKSMNSVLIEKDYIALPKPNGYRSYHMILEFPSDIHWLSGKIYAEVQLRTIAMDCWASLEHQLKYKKAIKNQDLIVGELKRCADEMASTDLSMQTIRELIDSSF